MRRTLGVLSLLLFLAALLAWHGSYDADYAAGLRWRRVSRAQGGRWEYRFAGLSVHRGLLGIGVVQERTAAAPPVTDYVHVRDGISFGINSCLWRLSPREYTVGGFGLRRVNIAPAGTRLGYAGWVAAIPLWLPTLLLAWPLAARYRRIWREARQLHRARQGLCPMCGYDLRQTRDRCPECGAKRTETWPTTA